MSQKFGKRLPTLNTDSVISSHIMDFSNWYPKPKQKQIVIMNKRFDDLFVFQDYNMLTGQ